jgi:hypothetical protein
VAPDRVTFEQSPSVVSRWRAVGEWVVVIAAVKVSLLGRSYA